MDNDESADFRPRRASQPEPKASSVYGFDPSFREGGSEPATMRVTSQGVTSRSLPERTLADMLSQSIIQYGLNEAAYMSIHNEDRARLYSPMLSSAGTWASAEDLVPRIYPGCQLESLEATPLASRNESTAAAQSLPAFEPWCERVLRQLAEEAHGSSSEVRRDLETMTLAEIAQVLGLEDWKQSEAVTGYVAPLVPRLNLESIKREVDECDEYDEEDFVNKVGSEAVGVANSIPKTHEVKAKVPPLALNKGEHEQHSTINPLDPISVSKSTSHGSKKKGGLLPLAEVLKRKSRRDLSMYCDDLTLMLLKHRPHRAKKGLTKSHSAQLQLPPLEHKRPVAQPEATPMTCVGWQQGVVHDHYHYHFHVPSGPL